jgi:hypothetical protein
MAVLLAISAVRTPAANKVLDGARNFGRQFHSLRTAQMNPIERFVLSLMLAS